MARAETQQVVPVSRDKLFDVITRYEDYPQFVSGCTRVEVERKGPGKARATYHVSLMKDVTYTLDHSEDRAAGVVSWDLVESDFFKSNTGEWTLEEMGPSQTRATYTLEVDFKIPVPGFILKRLIQSNLPAMVKSFAERAQAL